MAAATTTARTTTSDFLGRQGVTKREKVVASYVAT